MNPPTRDSNGNQLTPEQVTGYLLAKAEASGDERAVVKARKEADKWAKPTRRTCANCACCVRGSTDDPYDWYCDLNCRGDDYEGADEVSCAEWRPAVGIGTKQPNP